jgi:hypothetical protein
LAKVRQFKGICGINAVLQVQQNAIAQAEIKLFNGYYGGGIVQTGEGNG